MRKAPTFIAAIAVACLTIGRPAIAEVGTLRIGWSALGKPVTKMAQHTPEGSKLATELGGKRIEISGYLLPVDREGDLVYEFLLFPWAGACIHTPAPPPNQIVHVWPKEPFKLKEIYQTVSISGTLEPELETTQLMMLDGIAVVESGYSIGKAEVVQVDAVKDAPAAPQPASPWKFLKK